MKKKFLITAMALMTVHANLMAQSVGIGTTTPNNSAQLDVSSTSKGVLIPRVTQAQRDLIAPVEGLMLYNTNSNSFQYFSGGTWINVAHSGIINGVSNKVAKFSGTWSLVPGLLTDNGTGVAINTNNANPANSALLDISSNNKGILVPRMTTTERNAIASPAKGLLLFDNTTNSFWFHNGANWVELSAGNGSNNWALNGNHLSNLNSGNVGIGTAVPTARLHVADSAVLFSTSTVGTPVAPYANPPMVGPGNRMMWYPAKAAFRAGGANLEWDGDKIGIYSVAMGTQTTSSGVASFSTGVGSSAINGFSTSMGYYTTASGSVSTSLGNSTTASGNSSISMGYYTTASGLISTSMGQSNTASGNTSTSMGYNTIASGLITTSMGNTTQAVGDNSTSMGENTITKARGGVVMGSYNDNTDNPNPTTMNQSDRIFQIGNGTSIGTRSNAVTVLRNGNTGIGVLNPGFILDVNGRMRIQSSNSLSAGINLNNDANSAIAAFMGMRSTDNEVGFYGYTGTAGWRFLVNTTTGNAWMQGALTQNSDIRLKKNIVPLSNTLSNIGKINGYRYHWKDPSNPDLQIGFIAQELQKIYPELVKENEQGDLSVNYSGMIPVLLEAIKELQQKVEELEKKLK